MAAKLNSGRAEKGHLSRASAKINVSGVIFVLQQWQ